MKSKHGTKLATATMIALAAGLLPAACSGGSDCGGADPAATASPSASQPSGTGAAATGATGTTATSAAATAPAQAQAGGATAPGGIAAQGSTSTGTLIPLYTPPSDPSWAAVAAAKRAHPSVPVVAVVNPSNGPGPAADPGYTTGISQLIDAGVKVLGYVHTQYGARPAADVHADVDLWRSFYPQVTGIFFDEQANTAGYESYYKELDTYAKAHSLDFTVGNPGADAAPTYVGTVDVMLIYESPGLPSLSFLAGWHATYDRHNFGIIPYGVSGVDPTYVQSARAQVGYIYIQSDNMPNPWDSVPAYLDTLVAQLQ